MNIAIIGPAHPYKGGIAKHTTTLANQLSKAGHTVTIVSWKHQYPFFYPGDQFVPIDQPEITPLPETKRVLSWRNPPGWWRWGRRLRKYDQVIFIWWVPTIQGPVYLNMLRAMGKNGPRTTLICHNVMPHEPRKGDERLARAVLSQVDQVIVHSEAQANIAKQLTTKPVKVTDLPLILLSTDQKSGKTPTTKNQLLFFGMVRPYKGLDVLLKALAAVPKIKLTIIGEFWGSLDEYTKQVNELGLKERVTIHNEYMPDAELARQIGNSEAVVLPYKSGTATWNVELAHAYGTPVIATTAGSLADHVHDGVDGLLCKPDDVPSLAKAIKHFYEPGVAAKLKQGVPKISTDEEWQRYVKVVTKD